MKVILLEDVKGVGKKDQIIDANDGYAKNFLLPKKLAVLADKNNLTKMDNIKKIEDAKNSLSNEIENNKKLIYLTNEKLKNAVQKVSIIRYNPFEEVGGDLCYAIALLDENNNGIVLNSIYSREACYNYAKEIINGESPKHKLSQEEEEALKKAMNK